VGVPVATAARTFSASFGKFAGNGGT